jgi:hypothetical protein
MPRLAFNRKDMAKKREETMRPIVWQASPTAADLARLI